MISGSRRDVNETCALQGLF